MEPTGAKVTSRAVTLELAVSVYGEAPSPNRSPAPFASNDPLLVPPALRLRVPPSTRTVPLLSNAPLTLRSPDAASVNVPWLSNRPPPVRPVTGPEAVKVAPARFRKAAGPHTQSALASHVAVPAFTTTRVS